MPAPASTPNHNAGTSAVRRANARRNSRKPLAARIPIAPIAGSASCGILPSERTLRSTGAGAPGTSGRGSRSVSAAEIPYARAATYTGPSPPTAFRTTKPTGAAPSAPATAIRPRRALARIRPSCFEAYAIVRPFFTMPCTRERTSITSTTGNSRFDDSCGAR